MVRIWQVDGTLLKTLKHHKAEVKSVSFSPDGQTLATAGADGKIILWNLNLEEMLVEGCQVLRESIHHHPNITQRDRRLCDGIGEHKTP